jgi:tetratricopeptide (TPR) repeat protein
MTKRRLSPLKYPVGWIVCSSGLEALPWHLMLDEEHESPHHNLEHVFEGRSIYTCGSVAGHNVVIANWSGDLLDRIKSRDLAQSMLQAFSGIKIIVMMDVGQLKTSSAAQHEEKVKLGDIFVYWFSGAGQSSTPTTSELSSSANHAAAADKLDRTIIDGLSMIVETRHSYQISFEQHRQRLRISGTDSVFDAPKSSSNGKSESGFLCHHRNVFTETTNIAVHDTIPDGGAVCIEAATAVRGTGRSCFFLRGISSYIDSDNSELWLPHAAGNTAILIREVMSNISPEMTANLSLNSTPNGHSTIPFRRDIRFAYRREKAAEIRDALYPGIDEEICQRIILHGPRTTGKTQFAVEVAHRIRDKYPACSVFWLSASSLATFENGYRKMGETLGIRYVNEYQAKPKNLIKSALSKSDAGRWVLIVDDANDLDLLFGKQNIISLLPSSPNGSILFTSWNDDVVARLQTNGQVVALKRDDIWGPSDSSTLELHRIKCEPRDEEAEQQLLKSLDHDQLAIGQAVAFMLSTKDATIRDYLSLYKSDVLTQAEVLRKTCTDEPVTLPVAATWLISFQQLCRVQPPAAEWLHHICYLAPDDIPRALLPDGTSHLMSQSEALGILESYGFIETHSSSQNIFIYRSQQLLMRAWLQKEGLADQYITAVTSTLFNNYPLPKCLNHQVWMEYLPHLHAILEAQESPKDSEQLQMLIHHAAESHFLVKDLSGTENLSRRGLAMAKSIWGLEHTTTITSMQTLGKVLNCQSRDKEAEPIYRQAAELSKKLRGPNHDETLRSMATLGFVLCRCGKYEEARQIHEQVLGLRGKTMGREHPSILDSLNALGTAYLGLEKVSKAKSTFEDAVELSKKIKGPTSDDTLLHRHNLAIVLNMKRQFARAAEIHKSNLDMRRNRHGPEHELTLDSMRGVAWSYERLNLFVQAEAMVREVVETSQKVLGQEHPRTRDSMIDLVYIYKAQGKYDAAEALCRTALVAGENMPSISRRKSNVSAMKLLQNLLKLQMERDDGRRDERRKEIEELEAKIMATDQESYVDKGGPKHEEVSTLGGLLRRVLRGGSRRKGSEEGDSARSHGFNDLSSKLDGDESDNEGEKR